MTVIGKTSHALFFNGVNDSVVCPMHEFIDTGVKFPLGSPEKTARSSRPLLGGRQEEKSLNLVRSSVMSNFAIEAWIRPDCGGVVAFKEGLFSLSVGSVGAPAPAIFTVSTMSKSGEVRTFTTRSAQTVGGSYSGIIYPTAGQSFVTNNTELSKGGRELLHVVGLFTQNHISIFINGTLVSRNQISAGSLCHVTNSEFYIGGKGGQFRGHIEGVHWKRDASEDTLLVAPLVRMVNTVGLWRFEEPIEVCNTEFYIKSNAAAGATTLTLDTSQVQSLYELISGKSTDMPSTYPLPSLGDYQVAVTTHSAGAQVVRVPHTTVNLLINPTCTDTKTGRPNFKPPERVRLKSIASAGTITVESVHLDFDVTSDTGSRGILHARTAFDATNNLANDSTIVLLYSDLLLDPGSGNPIQPSGMGSQAIDRNGMTVIDESLNRNHGFLYSKQVSTNESGNPYTVSTANWVVDEKFKAGHSGRHKFSHVAGHPYLRLFPDAHKERVTQTVDGLSDLIYAMFDGQSINLNEQVPINSQISLFKRGSSSRGRKVITTTTASQVKRNGLSILDPDRDEIIAIGGAGFNITPFLLKGHAVGGVVATDDIYDMHLAPETESRVAILETGGGNLPPYVEIHYNAIDLTGGTMGMNGPALLVNKTVPSGGSVFGSGSGTIAAKIATAISSGKILHAPGGLICIDSGTFEGPAALLKNHNLVGDNTGGRQYEVELDLSMLPTNYTPQVATDPPNSPPLGIDSSHAEDASHPSVYHHLILRTNNMPAPNTPSGVPDYRMDAKAANRGPTNQSTHAHEVFDIIDNYSDNTGAYIIVHPTDRTRTLQLSKFAKSANDPSMFSIEYLMSRGRVSAFKSERSERGLTLTMHGRGLMDDVASTPADYLGEGSPDSVIVKETRPDAPVVTVTLGGSGQGAVETTPTWDKSPLTRLGWTTRRDGGARCSAVGTTYLAVRPLNNESSALADWGTYMFPPRGRIHLESGASAEYYKVNGMFFHFKGSGGTGTGRYLNVDGSEVELFSDWTTSNSVTEGDTILLDPLFDEASIVADGTTINDRLFQSLGSVAHDYQLGTQYASTRALVEIPVFSNQFFDDPSNGVFPGPDNSMKIHLDPTLTAHSWAPNPVGRRPMGYASADRDVIGPYHTLWAEDKMVGAVKVTAIDMDGLGDGHRIHVSDVDAQFLVVSNQLSKTYTSFRNIETSQRVYQRLYRTNGEWALGTDVDTTNNFILIQTDGIDHSPDFWEGLEVGALLTVGPYIDTTGSPFRDDTRVSTAVNEFRRPFYYDRANIQTQGGNIDYGLRQYVSAVEFKEGPTANPHCKKIESKAATFRILNYTGTTAVYIGENLPSYTDTDTWGVSSGSNATLHMECVNHKGQSTTFRHSGTASRLVKISGTSPAVDDIYTLKRLKDNTDGSYFDKYDGYFEDTPWKNILSKTWDYPYAPGGLRHGDTVWMNMHYTNPHAIEGLFCKSRGVLNEFLVWNGFNEGRGEIGAQARDSIPLENFLIGDSCMETAQNFVQHVNKTVELNWVELGNSVSTAPVVAYLDPYLAKVGHARVLLYDVAHDREFIAFHDIHMQVQTGQATPRVNSLDVANGFASQRRDNNLGATDDDQSAFIEGAYAHRSSPYMEVSDSSLVEGPVFVGSITNGDATVNLTVGNTSSLEVGMKVTRPVGSGIPTNTTVASITDSDTFEMSATATATANHTHLKFTFPFGEHDSTVMNPAYIDYGVSFLGSTGRTDNTTVKGDSLSFTEDYSVKRHKLSTTGTHHATFMDTPDGTRAIPAFLCLKGNRANALDLTTHSESRLQHLPQWTQMDFVRRLTLDLGEIGQADGVSDVESAVYEMVRRVNQASALQGRTAAGSAHDPAPFWDDTAFDGDKGSHMGYLRAHFGRGVKDLDGNDGYTIVIHSTVPGASGRNFCAWLDNSRGQSQYRPRFLVGHGGRFRSFWAMPIEGEDENMHPAPMPITKNGRPFAPITTLRQMVPPDEEDEEFINNLAHYESGDDRGNSEMATGRGANTVYQESFESQGDANRLIEGLRPAGRAHARINFGGLVASGVPGWAPDAGPMGFGMANKGGRFEEIYTTSTNIDYTSYVTAGEQSASKVGSGELYGFRFTDHRGRDHTIRLVYRQKGESFASINTILPPSLENEIIISFDDRDVSSGGFTIGKNMKGNIYPTSLDLGGQPQATNVLASSAPIWRGNLWNGIRAPASGYAIKTGSALDGTTFTAVLSTDTGGGVANGVTPEGTFDLLGFLGFPLEGGLVIYTDNEAASTSSVFRYTSRTTNDETGPHNFQGVTGLFGSVSIVGSGAGNYGTISPMLNWTTIVTDELIAAAVEYAMSVDPNNSSAFDCSNMYAPDGKTYREWMGGGAKKAIQVHTLNKTSKVHPLKDLFSVSRSEDWGLYAGNADVLLSTANIGDGVVTACGYIPKTLLNITSNFRGENANTATPLMIKSDGSAVSTSEWQKHLRGEKFTAYAGDHITPCVNNSVMLVALSGTTAYTQLSSIAPNLIGFRPGNTSGADATFIEPFTVYDNQGRWCQMKVYGMDSTTDTYLSHLKYETNFGNYLDSGEETSGRTTAAESLYLFKEERGRLFAGERVAGNTYGEPLTYFRGAHDSPDHSVPLYFGGGFSGVVMDINDGTQNDYTEFYSHPYSSGPTGCAGLQNVGENMGAHAILDTTAMLAMFPGTPFLNQHRGESQSPFSNVDALLAPDMNVQSATGSAGYGDGDQVGNSPQTLGFTGNNAAINALKAPIYQDHGGSIYNQTAITHPTPIVLRFAHPYARYTAADTGCAEEVAYVVFGPGQSVPKHFKGYNNSGTRLEPSADRTVRESITHVYSDTQFRLSGTMTEVNHPNEMSRGWLTDANDIDTYTDRDSTEVRAYLPPPMSYQRSAPFPYSILRNWEPAYGTPSTWYNDEFTSPSSVALLISDHWGTSGGEDNGDKSLKIAHPFLDAGGYEYRWHMDGGYPAGGNWFDYAVRKNPLHPVTDNVLPDSQTASLGATVTLGLNASMFRVGSLALTAYDKDLEEANTPRDVFVVDATRVQNSEELATIISAAINSYPGEGNLKAMGGTFLPSFQEAIRQDRYSWVDVGTLATGSSSAGYSHGTSTVTMLNALPKHLPENGWIRLNKNNVSGEDVYYGKYSGFSGSVFTLANNYRFGDPKLEAPGIDGVDYPQQSTDNLSGTDYTVYVWSKTGNLRWSNGAPELHDAPVAGTGDDWTHVYHHLATTQVHFSGFVDAIDRTRPVGAVGWHGERYSYLNSLKIAKTDGPTYGVSAGLGAWHPLLGFNPYGSAMGVHSMNGPLDAYQQSGDEATFLRGTDGLNSGLHPRHYVVVSNEAELPIIAKADRDGLILCGDMLDKKWGVNANQTVASSKTGGTVIASHSARHNNDRFAAYAHGGPHVDAQFAKGFAPPSTGNGEWETNPPTAAEMYPMETCLFPTGDLFFDRVENPGVAHYPAETPINHSLIASGSFTTQDAVLKDPYDFWEERSAARNFFVNHIVWKRMDGGNLCLPAPNARGLGAIPWVWRKVDSSYVKFGETIYGNTRFSFESTNAAVFPTIQAQELAHPQLADKYPIDIGAALSIPNEEMQFEAITVVDDSGQEHIVEGGSPLGTVVRDFSRVADRGVKGPALAGSGDKPNIVISLPDPNAIPGNIIVRSGFDKVQAYQHETIGTGGMQRPDLPDAVVSANFDSANSNPSTGPFWENEGWERVDENDTSKSGSMTDKAPLQTSYEPHDRALYFHLTKMGWGYTEREPLGIVSNAMAHNPLTYYSVSGTDLIVGTGETIQASIWQADATADGRSFLTVNGHVVSFTGVTTHAIGDPPVTYYKFTGCKFTPGFTATLGDTMKPSFYVPAGSTRHFAARRLRDHAEVSGESPDKAPIDWMGVGPTESPAKAIRDDRLTPMPIPRMGHHYVTPTMAVMPGHLSHPLYQRVYNLNRAYHGATSSIEREQEYASVVHSLTAADDENLLRKEGVGVNALMWFSSPSSPHPPSDIHGGAFTLMVETKVRYDGYGILAYADENNDGDRNLILESGSKYSTHWHFPDPIETGAYQIIIQPNLFAQQLMGFSDNYDFGSDTGSKYPLLTDQQVATVVGLFWNGSSYDLVLAEGLKADVRGCEVFMNEVMLDIDPSPNQQFTSLPPLALYNPLGVNESTSPIWSRKSLPYQPGMFRLASPGYTLTVPWWAPALKSGHGGTNSFIDEDSQGAFASSHKWRKTEQYHPEDYYHYCRTGYGSVGAQSVMAGYPSHHLHPYTHSYTSFVPTCTIKDVPIEISGTKIEILVDNNSLFPEVGKDYFGNMLSITTEDGSVYTATYTHRGVSGGSAVQTTNRFYGVVANDGLGNPSPFWAAVKNNVELKLTGDYAALGVGKVYTDKLSSVAAHHIQDTKDGTKDTQTAHLPDAYLSMWHYNLGRPMTFYSDSRDDMGDAAIDKAPYNHLPEHYETVHYHDFGYVISDGPFDFKGYAWKTNSDENGIDLVAPSGTDGNFPVQARSTTHYGAFWPGGSRFGAQASRMDLWGTAGPGWGRHWDYDRIYTNTGPASATSISETINSVAGHKKNASFGYRFCVRPPFNKPRAALWATQAAEDTGSVTHSTYRTGPYVQNDSVTTNTYVAVATDTVGTSQSTTSAGYSGIIERVTNASAMVGSDLKAQQVRYSHGRRMCRPFGCAVRNIVNDPMVVRAHQGDYIAGIAHTSTNYSTSITGNRRNLASALAHYMIDWWGNTTGEEVRRLPVRGFGIRPAWDPEDAYSEADRDENSDQNFATPSGHGFARAALDFFDPATAKRVGDRGDGRGVRWPTAFNEDMLQEVDTVMGPVGLVLSANTSEPSLGKGYIRARNDDLQLNEVTRGISRRLDVHAADGLLKSAAMAGSNVEKAKEDLLPGSESLQEPISRIAPRIGLDSMTVGEITTGTSDTHIVVGTEAHSLHTDRVAGRRYIMSGGVRTNDAYSKPLADYDLSSLDFTQKDGPSGSSNVPHFVQVMRLNYTHGIWPLGGNLIMDLMNYTEPVDDEDWGTHFQGRNNFWSANPYETTTHNADTARLNHTDKSIKFLVRPVRVLDHRHLEIFRDRFTNALSATAAGRYGVFTYDTPSARATVTSGALFLRSTNPAPDNPPYPPAYHFVHSSINDNTISAQIKSYRLPISVGPKIPGVEASGFANSLKQTVARITVADNTLQHLRADASRSGDFTVQPRYSQSLYPGTNLNKSDHSGESSHTDNRVDG